MTPARGYSSGSGDSTTLLLLVILVGVGFLMWMAWQVYHAEISAAAMWIAHGEMQAIGFLSNRFEHADAQVLRTDPETVRFDQLARLFRNIGAFFLYPALTITGGLGAICFIRAGNQRFSRRLNLEGLIREHAKNFPFQAWIVGRRLGLAGVRKTGPRPADPALRLDEWLACWADGKDEAFDETKARSALARQLGKPWTGVADLPASTKCMLAVFALHGAGEREDAIELLGLLSASLPLNKRDGVAGPDQPLSFSNEAVGMAGTVLEDGEVAAWAIEAMDRHFYVTTGLMTVLTEARARAGALPPAQFAFLKLVDRGLWWPLHSLGFEADGLRDHPHPCPRIEAIGARSHWEAERAAKRRLSTAELDSALAGIKIALKI